jgi:hypothetical protein
LGFGYLQLRALSSTAILPDTDESKAAYDVVRRLIFRGKQIVGDAACCQNDICEEIMDSNSYVLEWRKPFRSTCRLRLLGLAEVCCQPSQSPQ